MEARAKNSAVFPLIRSLVRERLTGSDAFNALPKRERDEIAFHTVNSLGYILGGEDGGNIPRSITMAGNHVGFAPQPPATALAGPIPIPPPPQRPGLGEAARAGGQAFTSTIADVNFPQFVAGLIDGVFNSIVTTSIKQMEAYAEMVKNVSKSADQYMKDNVTENNARDYLAERYPDHLQVDIAGDQPLLKPKEGYDENNMPDFFADLGLKAPVPSLDDDNVEQELVPAARRRIALDRQQLLATMVMMGVNRLVVTNGSIEASCMFELNTTDAVKRASERTTTADWAREHSVDSNKDGSDTTSTKSDNTSGDYKKTWFTKDSSKDTASFKMSTVQRDSDDQTINLHAQMGGKVKVNFKSDYFPMERMLDVLQINQIRDKTQAGQPATPPPAPPPLPPMPVISAPPITTAPPVPPGGRP